MSKTSEIGLQGFDLFWQHYPRRVAKLDAQKAWRQMALTETDLPTLIETLQKQKKTEQWQQPQYIPYPATYLRGRRWEDEIIEELPAMRPKMTVEELARERGITAGVGESMEAFTRRVMSARH